MGVKLRFPARFFHVHRGIAPFIYGSAKRDRPVRDPDVAPRFPTSSLVGKYLLSAFVNCSFISEAAVGGENAAPD